MPGWDIIILQALHDVLVAQNGLEVLQTSQESLGWQDFLDQTYGLGLAPCPPPRTTSALAPYNQQSASTDRTALLAVKNHFILNGTPESSFKSWTAPLRVPSSPGRVTLNPSPVLVSSAAAGGACGWTAAAGWSSCGWTSAS